MQKFPPVIKFTITKKDYENSSKNFIDTENCPCAIAIKRVIKEEISVDHNSAIFFDDAGNLLCRYGFDNFFRYDDFKNLRDNGVEFEITATRT